MAETETEQAAETEAAETEPNGAAETDLEKWKGYAKTWEKRAKERERELKRLQAEQAEKAGTEPADTVKDELDALRGELEAMKAEKARTELVAKVASEKGVPASLLHGEDEDALRASADAIAAYVSVADNINYVRLGDLDEALVILERYARLAHSSPKRSVFAGYVPGGVTRHEKAPPERGILGLDWTRRQRRRYSKRISMPVKSWCPLIATHGAFASITGMGSNLRPSMPISRQSVLGRDSETMRTV